MIWWDNLKTEIQILNFQKNETGAYKIYNQYQYIFSQLAFWYIKFNNIGVF